MKSPFSPKKSSETPSQAGKPADTRKHARLPKKPLHKISLQLVKNGMYFKIANVSVGGIGFFSENDTPLIKDKPFPIQLHIDAKKFTAEIEIVHTEKGITGCRFKNPEPLLLEAISRYFVTELAALKVNMVETRDEEGTAGKTLFFRGQNNCELLIQEMDGVLQKFNIILFGNYIEGDQKGVLSVGEKIENSTVTLPQGVHLFKPVAKPLIEDIEHLIENAIRFVDGVEGLSEHRKKNLTTAISASGNKVQNVRKA